MKFRILSMKTLTFMAINASLMLISSCHREESFDLPTSGFYQFTILDPIYFESTYSSNASQELYSGYLDLETYFLAETRGLSRETDQNLNRLALELRYDQETGELELFRLDPNTGIPFIGNPLYEQAEIDLENRLIRAELSLSNGEVFDHCEVIWELEVTFYLNRLGQISSGKGRTTEVFVSNDSDQVACQLAFEDLQTRILQNNDFSFSQNMRSNLIVQAMYSNGALSILDLPYLESMTQILDYEFEYLGDVFEVKTNKTPKNNINSILGDLSEILPSPIMLQ